jgi:hypothetical protein
MTGDSKPKQDNVEPRLEKARKALFDTLDARSARARVEPFILVDAACG